VEVYQVQGLKGQAGEEMGKGSEDNSRLRKEGGRDILLPMGGDDGATDIAVGGHGEKGEPPPPNPELLKQSNEHTSPFNSLKLSHPQPPLPYSPVRFNNQVPHTTKSTTTTHSSTCKLL